MRVLFFVGEFNGGGAERVISIIANELVERNFDVKILKYHNTENTYRTDERIKISSVEENTNTRSNTFKNLEWMAKYFKKNADVVISFLAPFNILALLANMGSNVLIIVADRNDPNFVPSSTFRRKLRDLLYRKADAVVVQTNKNAKYFDYIKDKVHVIANPLTLNDNVGLALKTKKNKRIVSVGRLEAQKNQLMLINTFNTIHDEFNDYTLTIYGEGSYRKQLEDRIMQLNLNDCVFLPGNENDVFNAIKDAELFVLSSNYEGMPNALAEAMCLGLPCISTRVSGSDDLINDDNGILIDIGSESQLIESMRKLLSDKDLADKYAKNACDLASKLDVSNITSIWEELIRKVIK